VTRMADCHPDRKHKGNGLCQPCAQTAWRLANPGRSWQDRNPEAARASHREWYQRNRPALLASRKAYGERPEVRERERHGWLRRKYGLSAEAFRDMLIGQAGRCLICLRVPQGDLVVDHDHTTGKVRGLLCQSCNHGLGQFRDDPRLMQSAARYVGAAS
jgi:hypothetical protein